MKKKTINLPQDIKWEQITNPNSSVFTGVDNEVDRWLDPYVSGYAFFVWLDLPKWFDDDEDLKNFKRLSQINFRSFQNVGDITLNTTQITSGFAGHETNVVTGVSRENTEFSITMKEYSGGIMRKMIQKWISYIRDPRTGVALYPKLFNVEYGARNHSGQCLYIVVRPDATNGGADIVEYAAFYSNVFPTNVPLGTLYNFNIGEQDSPTIDITFKGFPEIGPHVEKFAQKVLQEKILKAGGDSYLPFVDMYGSDSEAIKNVDWGTKDHVLSKIWNPEE